ncbi:MAG: glycosyltransferase family 2 protein [Proteobacteria bacterium]|nr:glycosyltransferase family 2 protein [Pseudomonadota bacterium]
MASKRRHAFRKIGDSFYVIFIEYYQHTIKHLSDRNYLKRMQFSVIIPTYNYAHFLPNALESALAQEQDDFEILVIDDGSVDETPELMRSYCEKYPIQIKYFRQENRGPANVRNRGIKESCGDYLIFLDADDRLLPGALYKFCSFLQGEPNLDMVLGGHLSVHENGKEKIYIPKPFSMDKKKNFVNYIRGDIRISHGAAIMDRRVFEKIKYPDHIRNSEDIPVFAQVLALFHCASFPDPVLKIFKHSDSLRNNTKLITQVGTDIVDILFDSKILTPDLMLFRNEFLARRYLTLFRSLYVSGYYSEARTCYHSAIKLLPVLLSDGAYLRKYLLSFIKKG